VEVASAKQAMVVLKSGRKIGQDTGMGVMKKELKTLKKRQLLKVP
jgi:hypothetical protein